MRETLTLEDKNVLFDTARAMHDEEMTHLAVEGNTIRIEYGRLSENVLWHPYRRAVVTYVFDAGAGYTLSLVKLGRWRDVVRCYANDPARIARLNQWHMEMDRFSIDLWGDMTLHFGIWRRNTRRNAELTFTPLQILYDFTEAEHSVP